MKGHDSSSNPTGQDHFEFCWIVWRTKKVNTPSAMTTDGDGGNIKDVNLDLIRDGVSFRNPAYDFFMGQTGRKRGFLGYTLNADLDKEKVTNHPNGEVYCGYRRDGSNLVNTGNLLDGTFPLASGTFEPKGGIPANEDGLTV